MNMPHFIETHQQAVQGKLGLAVLAALLLAALMPVYSVWQEAVYQQDEYLLGLGLDSLVMVPMLLISVLYCSLYYCLYRYTKNTVLARWVLYVLASSMLLHGAWLTVYFVQPATTIVSAVVSLFVVTTALCELVMAKHLFSLKGFRWFAWLTLLAGVTRLGFLFKGLVGLWPGLVLSFLPGLCLFLSFNALALSLNYLRHQQAGRE